MALNIIKRLDFGITFIDFEWEWDNLSIEGIFEDILEGIKWNEKIVLWFDKLIFWNSKFLWNMFYFAEEANKMNVKVCIYWVNNWIKDAFEVVGIYDVIPKMENMQEVLNYLNS